MPKIPRVPGQSPSKPIEVLQPRRQEEFGRAVAQASPSELRQIKAATVYPNWEPIQQYLDRELSQNPAYAQGGATFTGGPPGYTFRPAAYERQTGTPLFRSMGDWLQQTAAPLLQRDIGLASLITGRHVRFADALEAFNRSPAGVLLQVFDAGAVAAERASGFALQASLDPRGTLENPGAAWRAGDIQYELSQTLPEGISPAYELAGARRRIAAGSTPQEEVARLLDAYPQLASQMMVADAVGHIVLDPLNLLMMAVKPVEVVQRTSQLARWGTRVSDDIIQAAEVASRAANAALDNAVSGGRTAEAAAATISAIAAAENYAELAGRAMSPFERFAVWITGGLPMSAENVAQFTERAGKLGLLDVLSRVAQGDWRAIGRWGTLPWNIFRLTPQSMATEILENVQRSGQLLVGGSHRWEDVVDVFARAGSGMDTTLPHFFMSPGGRQLRSWFGLVNEDVANLGQFMAASGPARSELANLAAMMGRTADDLLTDLIAGKADDVMAALQQAVTGPTELTRGLAGVYGRRIADGLLTSDTLRDLARTFEGMPFDLTSFQSTVLERLWERASQVATTGLGVQAQGWWARQFRALKAVETLAFLRFNPGYVVRNFWNNELTMLLRGVWGTPFQNSQQILSWWRKTGVVDPALLRGIGAADIEAASATAVDRISDAMSAADRVIAEATSGDLTPVENVLQRIRQPLQRFDMGEYGRRLEQWASARAFTTAFMDANPYYVRVGRGLSRMPESLRGTLGEDVARAVEGSVTGVYNADGLRAALYGNLNTSYGGFVGDVTGRLGVSEEALGHVLGQEFVARFYDDARPLMEAGDIEGLRALGQRYVREAQQHIDDLARHTDIYDAAFQGIVNGDGPAAVLRWRGRMNWMETSSFEANLGLIEVEIPRIRAIADEATQRAAWQAMFLDTEANAVRAQRWQEDIARGLTRGADRAGLSLPEDIGTAMAEQNRAIREFFRFRNDGYRAAYSLEGEARDAAILRHTDALDTQYQQLIQRTLATDARVDNAIGSLISDPSQRRIYDAARLRIRQLRERYMIDMRQAYRTAPPVRGGNHQAFFEEVVQPLRRQYNEQMYDLERQYLEAMSGNPAAIGPLEEEAALRMAGAQAGTVQPPTAEGMVTLYQGRPLGYVSEGGESAWYSAYREYAQDLVGPSGTVVERQVPKDVWQRAMEDAAAIRRRTGGPPDPTDLEGVLPDSFMRGEAPPPPTQEFLPDLRHVGIQDTARPDAIGFHELWNEQGGSYVRAMQASAEDLATRRPLRLGGLDPETENALRGYVSQLEEDLPGARMAALKQAEVRRDSALLNYGRRTEFDTYAGMVFPFSFWMTHSMFNWALWSLDRPGVIATWLRVRRLFDTVQQEQWVPQRMRGFRMPINVPFAPSWLGPVYANPLAFGLPFDQWARSAEDLTSLSSRTEARVERVLDVMLENGEIDQQAHDEAIRTRQGGAWETAQRQVGSQEDGWIDVFSFLSSPHAPITWALNAARGRPFQPGPFLPATRSIRSVTAMLGIGPAGGVNIEAPIRRMLNLPEFDQWDEYRIDRQLAVMAAEGIPVEVIERARIERQGPVYEEAQRRAGQQYAVSGIGGLLGVPLQGFPPGEQQQRQVRQQFLEEVMPELDRGNVDAYQEFVQEHPEVESWFAINSTPEERLQRFLVDLVWENYNNLPDYNQQEARDQFGGMFRQYFLSRETRDYTAVPPEVLSGWARALGGEIPSLSTLTPSPIALELTPPQIANRIQGFYDSRRQLHDWDAIRDAQTEYFALTPAARRSFAASHPELGRYWDWRRDFLYRNPDLIPYLVEDPDSFQFPSAAAYEAAQAGQPSLAPAEWYQVLGPQLWSLVDDYQYGEDLPPIARQRLSELADQYGTTVDHILADIAQGQTQ